MKLKKRIQSDKRVVFTILKYLYSFLLILLSYKTTGFFCYVLIGETELLLIMCLSDILIRHHKAFGWLNSIFLFLLNAEYTVLYFSGSYVTYVMLENIDSAKDLAGKAAVYIIAAGLCVLFSFLPVGKIPFQRNRIERVALVAVLLEVCGLAAMGAIYSPGYGVYSLYRQWNIHRSLYADLEYDLKDYEWLFDSDGITEEGGGAAALSVDSTNEGNEQYTCGIENPNVILIFTEGLSYNIITDERGIMPNVTALQDKSISFENYYNHTFATYRGLIGQLYSGHQLDDYDTNSLISIQDILRDQGYWTTIINTEPYNSTFSDYLFNFGFDEVVEDKTNCSGNAQSLTDKEAYDLLFETAVRYNEEKEEPFFLVIYTFGTHTSLDSADEIYGDGTERVLNRFYNVDYQFGQFMSRFEDSELASNTVIVFTADHATFSDEDFRSAFPDYDRACSDLDEIPFLIYCANGPAVQLDAGGRNSLDMAPTVLDYLNISEPNYFLGNSLFAEKADGLSLDTFFYDPTYLMNTDGDTIRTLDTETKEMVYELLRKYFSVSTQERSGQ